MPLAAGLAVLGWLVLGNNPVQPPATLAELLPAIDAGQAEAAAEAQAIVRRDPAGSLATLSEMVRADNWRRRAVACTAAVSLRPDQALPLLIARANDSDWHVRAAAMEALSQFQPFAVPLPMQSTPLVDREQVLLGWLAAYDGGTGQSLQVELCEMYSRVPHLEFGRPMIDRCLSCHVGDSLVAFEANEGCAQCHESEYGQWSGSAHAQSLSHLQLTTVDPQSRQAHAVDFGPLHGISCSQCHALQGGHQGNGGLASPADSDSCIRCHETVQRQWMAWRAEPHPRRLNWPPGQIDMHAEGDTRACVDCHMLPEPTGVGSPASDHRWAARRSPEFLSRGLQVQANVRQADSGSLRLQVVLTNLAGHSYPTGTHLRAVRLYATNSVGQEMLLATLSPDRPGQLFLDAEPALRPGESRTFEADIPDGQLEPSYRLVYYRNLSDPTAYSVEFLTELVDLPR